MSTRGRCPPEGTVETSAVPEGMFSPALEALSASGSIARGVGTPRGRSELTTGYAFLFLSVASSKDVVCTPDAVPRALASNSANFRAVFAFKSMPFLASASSAVIR